MEVSAWEGAGAGRSRPQWVAVPHHLMLACSLSVAHHRQPQGWLRGHDCVPIAPWLPLACSFAKFLVCRDGTVAGR